MKEGNGIDTYMNCCYKSIRKGLRIICNSHYIIFKGLMSNFENKARGK